jgi:alpha-beta hydrolase superfamily lysophospholipase
MAKEFIVDVRDGTKLQCYSWEPENQNSVKALIVIIHGLGEHAGKYEEYAGYFASQGIAVFSMDLRGHGKSPGKRGHTSPRGAVLLDIDDLCEASSKKYPGIPLFIYGHSMGGNLALHHRLEGAYRPRAYIITSPWIRLYRKVPGLQVLALRVLSKIKPDICVDNGIKSSSLTSDESQIVHGDSLAHRFVSIGTALDCNAIAEKILKASHEDHGELLLLHGTEDSVCSIEGSREFMKRAPKFCSYREWEGCRHELQHDKDRDIIREYIKDWVLTRT